MSNLPKGAGALIGKRLGKYEVLALLALGGTAEIYLARIGGTAGFEKYVVIKCLHEHLADDQDFVKMFLDEARLAAQLAHSNVAQTLELGEYQNRYFMVMEYLVGLSLSLLARKAADRLPDGLLPIPLTVNLIAQACAGLHYAHERTSNGKPLNIVHRDISPQNLVVTFEGIVKVVDFGIAKAEHRETHTKSGTIKGKFAYMSPEQCVSQGVDRRTDVFALGIILHELLTGKRLFKRPNPYDTYQAVIDCKILSPAKLNPNVDTELALIVMKALAKNKENRYASAEAFGEALMGYLYRRNAPVGPADIARLFDTQFAAELEEHGERMRELMATPTLAGGIEDDDAIDEWNVGATERQRTGRPSIVDDILGKPEPKAEQHNELSKLIVALSPDSLGPSGKPAGAARSASVPPPMEDPSEADDDDDDLPAESTRIEANPELHVQQMNRASSQMVAAPSRTLTVPGVKSSIGVPKIIPSISGKPPRSEPPSAATPVPPTVAEVERPKAANRHPSANSQAANSSAMTVPAAPALTDDALPAQPTQLLALDELETFGGSTSSATAVLDPALLVGPPKIRLDGTPAPIKSHDQLAYETTLETADLPRLTQQGIPAADAALGWRSPGDEQTSEEPRRPVATAEGVIVETHSQPPASEARASARHAAVQAPDASTLPARAHTYEPVGQPVSGATNWATPRASSMFSAPENPALGSPLSGRFQLPIAAQPALRPEPTLPRWQLSALFFVAMTIALIVTIGIRWVFA